MADVKIIGAVAVKVRPDAKGFRKDLRDDIMDQLRDYDVNIKVDAKIDDKALDREADRARQKAEKKMHVKWHFDYDSLDDAVKQVEKKLKDLSAISMDVKLNEKDLRDARKHLDGLRKQANVEMKIVEDEAGYKQVLDKIRGLQREKLLKKIEFQTDDDSLADAAEKYEKLLGDLVRDTGIDLKFAPDRKGFQSAIAEIDKELDKIRQTTLNVALDEASLRREREKLEETLSKEPFQLKVDWGNKDSILAAKRELESQLSNLRGVALEVDPDEHSIREAIKQVDDAIKKMESDQVDLTAAAHTAGAAAQMAYVSRGRFADIFVRVNKRSLAIAEGVLQSLAGLNTLRSLGRGLESLATNFDRIAIKAGGLSTIVGNLANVTSFAVTGLFAVGDGMAKSVGLLALAPAALASIAAIVAVNVAAWNGFGDAVKGSEEALAKLPPAARGAAKSLTGAWTEIEKRVQGGFWHEAGDAMRDMVKVILPQVTDGLGLFSTFIGEWTGDMFRSFEKIGRSGELETMIKNLAVALDLAEESATPFFDAINKIGLRGSAFLPSFGQWLTDIATQFNDWVQAADEAGDINRWIQDGVQSLKDMWRAGDGAIDMLRGLTGAINIAGMGGLGALADALQRIGRIMLAEPFQSRMARIFEGANDGASALNEGVTDLGVSLGEAASFVGDLLEKLGELGGGLLSGIARGFAQIKFQDGMLDAADGLLRALDDLGPSFDGVFRILGEFGSLAGEVLQNLAPLINTAVGTLDEAMSDLGPALQAISGPLAEILGGLLQALSGPLLVAVESVSAAIKALADAPPVIQNIVVALAGLAALKFGGFFTGFASMFGKLRDQTKGIGPVFAGMSTEVNRRIQDINRGLRTTQTGPFVRSIATVETAAGRMKTGLRGLTDFLGGPWVLGIMAGVAVLADFGKRLQQAEQDASDFRASLDQETGSVTDQSLQEIMGTLEEIPGGFMGANHALNGFASLWGGQTHKASEVLATLGTSLEEVSQSALDGTPMFEQLYQKLVKVAEVKERGGDWEGYARSVGFSSDAVGKFANFGLENLINRMGTARDQIGDGKQAWQDWHGAAEGAAEVVERIDPRMQDLGNALQVMGDEAGNAEERVRGLKEALEILNGEAPTTDEALHTIGESFRELEDFFKGDNGKAIDMSGLIDVKTGEIAVSEFGTMLRSKIQEINDESLQVAVGMDTEGESPQAIFNYLETVRADFAKTAADSGIKSEEVEAAWTRIMNGTPEQIAMMLSLDIDPAMSAAEIGAAKMAELDAMQAVATLAGDDTALGLELALAYGDLDQWDAAVGTATADMNPQKADAVRQRLMADLIQLAKTDPTVLAHMDPRFFEAEERRILAKLADLDRQKPSPEVDAETAQAQSELRTVQTLLGSIDGKVTSSKHTHTNLTVNKVEYREGARPKGGGVVANANGSISGNRALSGRVLQFANGGHAGLGRIPGTPRGFERHIAMIARPGVMPRVWAERETKGETYIPHAASKRPRSLKILGQTASMFGYSLVRNSDGAPGPGASAAALMGRRIRGGMTFADGGTTVQTPGTLSGPGAINLTLNNVPVDHAQETAETIMFALKHARRGGANTGAIR